MPKKPMWYQCQNCDCPVLNFHAQGRARPVVRHVERNEVTRELHYRHTCDAHKCFRPEIKG